MRRPCRSMRSLGDVCSVEDVHTPMPTNGIRNTLGNAACQAQRPCGVSMRHVANQTTRQCLLGSRRSNRAAKGKKHPMTWTFVWVANANGVRPDMEALSARCGVPRVHLFVDPENAVGLTGMRPVEEGRTILDSARQLQANVPLPEGSGYVLLGQCGGAYFAMALASALGSKVKRVIGAHVFTRIDPMLPKMRPYKAVIDKHGTNAAYPLDITSMSPAPCARIHVVVLNNARTYENDAAHAARLRQQASLDVEVLHDATLCDAVKSICAA